MDPKNAIEVRDMKKKFKVYFDKGHMLKERIIFANRNKHEDRWVLNGISFDVKKGEAIGLIGKNGCGKSTTLKLLNRIMYPNGGTVSIDGKVSSLIELGAGFHEDMTGRENIYINASIFGLTKKEIDYRLDDIIRFSELEDFIDNPVRTYSSGMYMRLAFSVAINVDADVLLIDEILAVGDVNFQEKCFQKLRDIKRKGTTIVIVSHSLGQIEKICDRAIWIDKGLIKEDGVPRAVCKHYLATMEYDRLERAEQEYVMQKEEEERRKREEEERRKKEEEDRRKKEEEKRSEQIRLKEKERELRQKEKELELRKKQERERKAKNATCREICKQCGPDARRDGNGVVTFTKIRLLDQNNKECQKFKSGEKVVVELEYKKNTNDYIEGNIAVCLTRNDWVFCLGFATKLENDKFIIFKEQGKLKLVIDELQLLNGKYFVDVFLAKDENKMDMLYNLIQLEIYSDIEYNTGVFVTSHMWEVDEKKIIKKEK